MSSLRLGLERIGVKGGHVIANGQLMQPIEFVQHKSRSKALSIPIGQILIDSFGFSDKIAPGAIQAAVVMKIVHANFEAFGSKFLAYLRRNAILSGRNEVKARCKAYFGFKLSQPT